MKKVLFIIISFFAFLQVNAQTLEAEKEIYNSQIAAGKMTNDQLVKLRSKLNTFQSRYKYPQLPVNKSTGEVDFSDTLTFEKLGKQIMFERCLEWIAINYGNLLHKDSESGKIIASGLMNLVHDAEFRAGFGSKIVQPTQTSMNYTLILTIKDNRIKYNIQNIEYTFTGYSETVNEITLPMSGLFPIIGQDEMQWYRYISVLNETKAKLYIGLKNSLTGYVNDYENDYKF